MPTIVTIKPVCGAMDFYDRRTRVDLPTIYGERPDRNRLADGPCLLVFHLCLAVSVRAQVRASRSVLFWWICNTGAVRIAAVVKRRRGLGNGELTLNDGVPVHAYEADATRPNMSEEVVKFLPFRVLPFAPCFVFLVEHSNDAGEKCAPDGT